MFRQVIIDCCKDYFHFAQAAKAKSGRVPRGVLIGYYAREFYD